MKILLKIKLLLITFFVIQACKGPELIQKVKLETKSHKYLEEKLVANKFEFEWIKLKASTNLKTAEEDRDFKTNIRIRKDSLIWMSVAKGPVPIFKIVITQDSIKLLNDFEETYFLGTINNVSKIAQADLSYKMLEDMFVGNPAGFDEQKKYKNGLKNGLYFLSNLSKSKIKKYLIKDKENKVKDDSVITRYWLEPENFRLTRTSIDQPTDSTGLEMNYANYTYLTDSAEILPHDIEIKAYSPKATINLKMNYSRIRLNTPTRFPFKIPEDYTRVYPKLKNAIIPE